MSLNLDEWMVVWVFAAAYSVRVGLNVYAVVATMLEGVLYRARQEKWKILDRVGHLVAQVKAAAAHEPQGRSSPTSEHPLRLPDGRSSVDRQFLQI